jgi:hypothetical protein
MKPMIRPQFSTSDGLFDSSYGPSVVPGSQMALVDDQTERAVDSHVTVPPDRILNQCLGLIMLGQGFVFFVAALVMLAR